MAELICCTPKHLPRSLSIAAAQKATAINPLNHPQVQHWAALAPNFAPTVERIAVLTTKFWHTNGVRLTVSFLDNPPSDLRARIVQHMNAWGTRCNVKFTETNSGGQVRIARTPASGYWSYLGTDILSITPDQPTMNLESFTMQTPESEYHRVVRHETGHTLGCPHEHMRAELVNKIDANRAIAFFGETQGWTPDEVRQQVLTPIEASTMRGTAHADANSIMCYQIPGTITKDGKPIVGGLDIDEKDFIFMATIYPKTVHTG